MHLVCIPHSVSVWSCFRLERWLNVSITPSGQTDTWNKRCKDGHAAEATRPCSTTSTSWPSPIPVADMTSLPKSILSVWCTVMACFHTQTTSTRAPQPWLRHSTDYNRPSLKAFSHFTISGASVPLGDDAVECWSPGVLKVASTSCFFWGGPKMKHTYNLQALYAKICIVLCLPQIKRLFQAFIVMVLLKSCCCDIIAETIWMGLFRVFFVTIILTDIDWR